MPADVAALPRPIIGFYGLVQDSINLDLLEYLVQRHPDWSFAMVGAVYVDISRFQRYPNIHFLGRKPHSELPSYCKAFSVGLMPHHVNELTVHMSPIKLREYLSAGLPVVSTTLPEALPYRDHLTVANDFPEFERGIEEALQETSLERKRARSDAIRVEGGIQVHALSREVMRVADQKRGKVTVPLSESVPFLVTGASGGVGSAVVDALVARGERVRVLVRSLPSKRAGIEVVLGDLTDEAVVDRAVRGARKVIHLGAATRGSWAEHEATTIGGTRHVVEACRRHGVEKLIHVSSLSVLDWSGAPSGAPMTEDSPLEPHPEQRGFYTQAKLGAERVVRQSVEDHGLPAVILRPGQIFGGKLPLVTNAVGRRLGLLWVVLGDGQLPLPLVYLDDVVRSILLAADGPLCKGEIVQIVDSEVLRQDEVLRRATDAKASDPPHPPMVAVRSRANLGGCPWSARAKLAPLGLPLELGPGRASVRE